MHQLVRDVTGESFEAFLQSSVLKAARHDAQHLRAAAVGRMGDECGLRPSRQRHADLRQMAHLP